MALRVSNYSYGEKRQHGEGLRLGSARLPPRGVRSVDYARLNVMDVWLPVVAPSRKLLSWALKSSLDDAKVWKTFVRRYKSEMKKTDARQTIRTLAEIAKKMPISVGCHCHGNHCHRFVLQELIRQAAAGKF
jgi:uncharacterized protein YeaO (DUF488 family)